MDALSFLSKQNPACTKSPVYNYLSDNYSLYAKLKKRCIAEFGVDLFSRYCGNREACGDACIGRPIPMYPELQQVMSTMSNVTKGLFRGKPVYLYSITMCGGCPLKATCTSLCGTMEDYFNKDESEYAIHENNMLPLDSLHEGELESEILRIDAMSKLKDPVARARMLDSLAWDALSEKQKHVVSQRLYSDTEFEDIGRCLGISRQAACKLYGTGYQKLIEYSKARIKLTSEPDIVRHKYYVELKSIKNIAQELNISKNNVAAKLLK